jgi:hypothetical protein
MDKTQLSKSFYDILHTYQRMLWTNYQTKNGPSDTMDKTQIPESFTLYIPKNAMGKLPNKEWELYPATLLTKHTKIPRQILYTYQNMLWTNYKTKNGHCTQ